MIVNQERFDQAINSFDAAHAEDPNRKTVDGIEYPKELLYAHRMKAMLDRFVIDASEALQLAVSAQSLSNYESRVYCLLTFN